MFLPASVRPGHLPHILYHRDGTEASSSPFLHTVLKVDMMLEIISHLTAMRQQHFNLLRKMEGKMGGAWVLNDFVELLW